MEPTALAFDRARDAFLAGLRHFEAGEFESAVAQFEDSLAALPGRVSTLVNLAAARIKLGEPERAVPLLDLALEQAAEHADAHAHRGQALFQLGRDEEALAAFDRAVALLNADAGTTDAALRASVMAQRALSLLALGRASEALAQLDALPAALASSAETTWHRGRTLQALERFGEAEAAYRRALAIDPQLAAAWGHLGALLKDAGRLQEATDCLRRAQTLDPEEPVHAFLLAALGAAAAPPTPPAHYVRALFDGYADDFDAHLVNTLHYRAPQQLAALLSAHLEPAAKTQALALDLGCGSGLLWPLLAPLVSAVDGVDLSPRMLAAARERHAYRHLHEAELVEFLGRPTAQAAYDVLAAADVLVYFGELAPLFSTAAQALHGGGLFGFSVELLDPADDASGHGWALRHTMRYAHSRPGLERWAAAAGLDWVADITAPLREEQGRPVPALTVVLRRPVS